MKIAVFRKFPAGALFEIPRFFEFTDPILAVFALQGVVGTFPELLRMLEQGDLPAQHQHNAGKE